MAFASKTQINKTLREWHSAWPHTSFIENPQKIALLARRIKKAKGGLPPMLLVGTDFQIKVWLALLDLPHGATVSYGELARRIVTARGACRGQRVRQKPDPLIIPCHRVIASDGTLGGFSGPMKIKKQLLKDEGLHA